MTLWFGISRSLYEVGFTVVGSGVAVLVGVETAAVVGMVVLVVVLGRRLRTAVNRRTQH